MFNPRSYENSRPDGFPVVEVTGDGENVLRRFVPLRRTELRGEVFGPLAALRLTQVFGYSTADCDHVLEAVYRFPLPGDAAVTGVRVQFGDVAIRAQLAERRRAEAAYEEAKREGRQAALATRESPDVFTLQVAGLRPDQDVTVETAYVQLARPEGPGWSLRVPLTTAPRYVRDDEKGTRPAAGQPLGLLRDPGHRFALDLGLRGAEAIASDTHRLEVAREGDRARVRLQGGETLPDRDCVLTWRPAQEPARPTLQAFLHDDPASGHVCFLVLVAPPATHDPGSGPPREAILLVDHSGSMSGAKWQAADWAVERFLADLTERDSFALALFHDTTRWFERSPQPATAEKVDAAIAFLKAHTDSGGTELGVALEQAIGLPRQSGTAARHVLVVTDAQVSDEGRILRLADQEAHRAERRRVSVLCIDEAPNSDLAFELAERSGGVARFLTSDPEEEDITTSLDAILADWSEPVLAGLRLDVDRPDVRAVGQSAGASAEPGHSSIDLGDLPPGRPLWVAGRAPRGESGALKFQLITGNGKNLSRCECELEGESPAGPALKALFGARRILKLERLIQSGAFGAELSDALEHLGYDPASILATAHQATPKVYAENAMTGAAEALSGLLVREALDYGLASSETAFIATRTEAGKPVEGRVAVANALPAGWSHHFLARPSSPAQSSPMRWCLSAPPPAPLAPPDHDVVADSAIADDDSGVFACMKLDDSDPAFNVPAAPSFLPSSPAIPVNHARDSTPTTVFSGVPLTSGGQVALFDSTQADLMPNDTTLKRLVLRFPDGTPDAVSVNPGLALSIFVDDLASPRARVRLADLIRQRGERPLNLRKRPGDVVRVVLVDPAGTWSTSAPSIELALAW
jgi:Ca-activated chloride channel family protein